MKKKYVYLLAMAMILSGCVFSNQNHAKAEEHYKMAQQFMGKRDADNAIVHLEKAIEYGYRDGFVYGMLGAMYKAKGMKEKAREYLTVSLSKLEQQREASKRLGVSESLKILDETIKQTQYQLATLDN